MGPFSQENSILHAKSHFHYWEGPGALSIKTFINGKAHYRTNRGFFAVEAGRYLLLNEGDYAISIESETEIESFCLFFRPGMAEEAARSLNLDDPFAQAASSVAFIEKTYPNDALLSSKLNRLRMLHQEFADDPLWLEEQFIDIIQILSGIHQKTVQHFEALPGLKPSTREELYRRVSVARDYVEACFDQPVALSELAKAACLSVNHLLRNYQLIYGKTPHQHITEKRMREAKRLIISTDQPMTEISFRCGFETASSFSKRFKRQFGMTPSQFRKKVRMEKSNGS